jgi:hypothetical protein
MYPPRDPPPVRTTGAARYWAEKFLGGPTREQESTPQINTTLTTIVGNNPDRVGLVMVNNSTLEVFAGFNAALIGINVGIPLQSGGGAITLNLTDDMTWITREWVGVCPGGFAVLYVLELISDVILTPEGP